MTTILVINAISSLLAGAGIGGWFVHSRRRARKVVLAPVYVTPRRHPRQTTTGKSRRRA